MATVTAQAAGGAAQTIESFVSASLDDAKISPLHRRVVALIAAGYFFDVIDFTVFGSLVPFLLKSGFATPAQTAAIGSATIFGLFIGTAGQGEFSDRFGRRFIYQFNLLLFGVFTILGALAPSITLLIVCRFIAGVGLGAEQPLCFAYAGEYAPKRIASSRSYPFPSAAPAYGRSAPPSCSFSATRFPMPTRCGAASG